MRRLFVTIGYLLWGIAFFPTAAMIAALVGVPYFLAVYRFHWVNEVSGLVGVLFYITLCFVLCVLSFRDEMPSSFDDGALNCYYQLMSLSGAISSVFFFVWCFGGMLHATFRDYVLWLGIPATLVTLISLVFFVVEARGEFRDNLLRYCAYPQDRKFLIRVLTENRYNYNIRRAALDKLSYPQERKILVQVAVQDKDRSIRRTALDKLPYPQERETIAQVALHDEDKEIRQTALGKLSYPQAREIFLHCAMSDSVLANRKIALDHLSPQLDKEAYFSVIDFCEKKVQGVHQNRIDSAITEAADTLADLYHQVHSMKGLTHCHKGSNPHMDHNDHEDFGYDDVWEDTHCGGLSFYRDDHTDFSAYSDKAHDDYYVVTGEK